MVVLSVLDVMRILGAPVVASPVSRPPCLFFVLVGRFLKKKQVFEEKILYAAACYTRYMILAMMVMMAHELACV